MVAMIYNVRLVISTVHVNILCRSSRSAVADLHATQRSTISLFQLGAHRTPRVKAGALDLACGMPWDAPHRQPPNTF
jgi:hypothetical protein